MAVVSGRCAGSREGSGASEGWGRGKRKRLGGAGGQLEVTNVARERVRIMREERDREGASWLGGQCLTIRGDAGKAQRCNAMDERRN